jgi:hypothetical protein
MSDQVRVTVNGFASSKHDGNASVNASFLTPPLESRPQYVANRIFPDRQVRAVTFADPPPVQEEPVSQLNIDPQTLAAALKILGQSQAPQAPAPAPHDPLAPPAELVSAARASRQVEPSPQPQPASLFVANELRVILVQEEGDEEWLYEKAKESVDQMGLTWLVLVRSLLEPTPTPRKRFRPKRTYGIMIPSMQAQGVFAAVTDFELDGRMYSLLVRKPDEPETPAEPTAGSGEIAVPLHQG